MSAWNLVPFRQRSRLAMQINAALNRRRIRRAAAQLSDRVGIVWIYDTTAIGLVRGLPAALHVYHCVDDYAGYVTDPARTALLEHAERLTCEWADIVYTTSAPLEERLRAPGRTVVDLRNVADYRHFSTPSTEPPPELVELPSPRVLFCGSFTRRKVDLEALARLADAMPAACLALVGPVTDTDSSFEAEFAALTARPNAHYLGPRPYRALPAILARCDVGVIPYVANRYTAGVFPMKVFEYLAAGMPVVALGLPALADLGPPVSSTHDHEAFLAAVAAHLRRPPDPEVGRALARRNTWETRLDRMEAAARSVMPAASPNGQSRRADGEYDGGSR
jgi:glycosyltransferase involved in cell wall biosynthesis